MVTADRIREYVKENFVAPARSRGQTTVTFRASEVHSGVKKVYSIEQGHRMPAVCSAIDTDLFLDYASVTLVKREGPVQGASVVWTFRV